MLRLNRCCSVAAVSSVFFALLGDVFFVACNSAHRAASPAASSDQVERSFLASAALGSQPLALASERGVFSAVTVGKTASERGVVVPGLVDAHAHMEGLGQMLQMVDLRGAKSAAEVVALVAARATTTPKGAWIIGRGWDQNRWPDQQMPHHQTLSSQTLEHPVLLYRVDGHACWVNRRALDLAKVARDTRVEGGEVLLDASSAPTGVLIDNAMALVEAVRPKPTLADTVAALRRAQAEVLRHGITMVHDMGVGAQQIAAYRQLQASGEWMVRVYAALDGSDEPLLNSWFASGPLLAKTREDRLVVRSIKLYADGALGSRGAWLHQDYADRRGHRGLAVTAAADLRRIVARAKAAGFQVATHAIGDAANTAVLDAYEAAGVQPGDRFRIEHVQVLAAADVARMARLQIIASMQPVHMTSDWPWAGDRLGPQRLATAYAWSALAAAGVRLAFGSDFPVEDPSVVAGLQAAVLPRCLDGTRPASGRALSGCQPQALSPTQALNGFTVGAHFASFSEANGGALKVGQWADYAVFDSDPVLNDKARVLEVVIDGQRAFVAANSSGDEIRAD